MLKDLSGIVPSHTPPPPVGRFEPRSTEVERNAVAQPASIPTGNTDIASTVADANMTLDSVAEKAATKMFPGREIKVESFKDEPSGRFVYRVADKNSGQVIHESPPEELLRFFASAREGNPGPIVHLEA